MRPERNIFALLFILRLKKAPVGTANPPFGGCGVQLFGAQPAEVATKRMLFADGGGRNERKASCSPPRWGGGELRGSKSRNISLNDFSYVTFCSDKR